MFHDVLRNLYRQSLLVRNKHVSANVYATPSSQIRTIALIFQEEPTREKVTELERKLSELEW